MAKRKPKMVPFRSKPMYGHPEVMCDDLPKRLHSTDLVSMHDIVQALGHLVQEAGGFLDPSIIWGSDFEVEWDCINECLTWLSTPYKNKVIAPHGGQRTPYGMYVVSRIMGDRP